MGNCDNNFLKETDTNVVYVDLYIFAYATL